MVERLRAELTALGHDVTTLPRPPRSGAAAFDVVHAINLDRSVLAETEQFVAAANAARVRVVVTPLWWPLDSFLAAQGRLERRMFKLKGWPVLRVFRERRVTSMRALNRRQAAVLSAASAVCVSGFEEGARLVGHFGPLPVVVVHFGTAATPGSRSVLRKGVLCVARLDPRKNQLRLIEAMRRMDIRLHLVGTHQAFPAYAAACRAAAGSDVEFSGFLTVGRLQDAYRAAQVHVLPSFFELPGLTSLDAAASGSAIVAGREGTAEEYFAHEGHYCGTDVGSISDTVATACDQGPAPGLADRVATTFTWRAMAEKYARVYAGATP
jgi:glycosyltransferase involved in cell wall biosynthesis